MGIIERYLIREILVSWITVLVVLLIIVLSTEVVHLLGWITNGVIPVGAFLSLLTNSLFEFSVVLVPLSLLMGILLGMGRLYKDSEMTAIMSFGVGPLHWYRPLMVVAVPAVLLIFVLTLHVRPLISQQRAVLMAEIKSRSEVDQLMVGQFNRASGRQAVMFLESEDETRRRIRNVFLNQLREGDNHTDIADGVESFTDDSGQRYMVMHHGVHYIGEAGKRSLTRIEYDEYGIRITGRKNPRVHLTESARTVEELMQSDSLRDKAELQWRIAVPVATFIVVCMALPLSRTDPRSGRYSRLAVALLIYLLYSNLLGVAESWIAQGKIHPWLGTLWVHAIALAVLFFLLKRGGYLMRVSRSG